jgi:SAM-dependent methyltransferase
MGGPVERPVRPSFSEHRPAFFKETDIVPRATRTPRPKRPGPGTRAFWDRATRRWESFEPQLLHSLSGVDPALIRALAPRPGQRLLDVGSGQGDPAIALAQLVAPAGSVTGIDISPRMLAIARLRARMRGVRNVRFRAGDLLQARLMPRRYHGVYSRFGIMFVSDIPVALARLHAALRPGGRAAFAVWGPLSRNPWSRLTTETSRPFLSEPPPPPEQGPHPLRLGRRDALPSLMRRAGFRRVVSVGVATSMVLSGEADAMRLYLGFPNPLRDLYLSLSSRDRSRLSARLLRGIRRYRSGPVVRIPEFAWVVSGRR